MGAPVELRISCIVLTVPRVVMIRTHFLLSTDGYGAAERAPVQYPHSHDVQECGDVVGLVQRGPWAAVEREQCAILLDARFLSQMSTFCNSCRCNKPCELTGVGMV